VALALPSRPPMPSRSARRPRRVVGLVAAVLALLLASCDLVAPTGPAPLRFRDEVFTSVDVTSNLVYGQATSQTGQATTLRFDLYEPAGDTSTARPLVIFIHGGSFAFGTKTSAEIVDQANVLARKGYVSASISYRLSSQGCTVVNSVCVESIVDAAEDAQAAVRYLRANAASYGIDPTRIAIAGTSAGAITALHVGLRANVAQTSGTPGVSSEVRGAVSLSGMNVIASYEAGDARSLLFHGTADTLTPYSAAQTTSQRSGAAGVPSYLITWEGAGHVPYVANRTQILDLTANFLYNVLDMANAG
jgi:acetyl esterase/lipase